MLQGKRSFKDYFFVGIQLLLFLVYLFSLHLIEIQLNEGFSYLGILVIGVGVSLGLIAVGQIVNFISPFPTPLSNGKLKTTGAFALTRHPIYTAILLLTLGISIYQASLSLSFWYSFH